MKLNLDNTTTQVALMPPIRSAPPTILSDDKGTVANENVGGAICGNFVCNSGKLAGRLCPQCAHVRSHRGSRCYRHLLRRKESNVDKKYTV